VAKRDSITASGDKAAPPFRSPIDLLRAVSKETEHPFWLKAIKSGKRVSIEDSFEFARIKDLGKLVKSQTKPSVAECCRIVLSAVNDVQIDAYGLHIDYVEGLIIEDDKLTLHAWIKHGSYYIDPISDELHSDTKKRKWAEAREYIALVEIKKEDIPGNILRVPFLPTLWQIDVSNAGGCDFENETYSNLVQRFTPATIQSDQEPQS